VDKSSKYDSVLTLALELAGKALPIMREVQRGELQIRQKSGPADPVTAADTRIEQLTRELIHTRFPEHRIVGEEQGETGVGDAVWFIDPVDGTLNYSRRLPFAAFTCAFAEAGIVRVGVVADPVTGEVLYASSGGGAWCGESRLQASRRQELAGAVVLLELEHGCRPWLGMLELMRWLAEREATVRILGSSALALSQVAAGRADLFLSGELQPYDKAGGLLLVEEAGGHLGEGSFAVGPARAGAPALLRLVEEFLRATVGR